MLLLKIPINLVLRNGNTTSIAFVNARTLVIYNQISFPSLIFKHGNEI